MRSPSRRPGRRARWPRSAGSARVPAIAELDAATVIEVSQTLSAEIVLDALVERLMVMSVETAGAARGLLAMQRDACWTIEARAAAGEDGVRATVASRVLDRGDPEEPILRRVAHSRERLIVDGGSACRICLPLLKRQQLVGVLYLEGAAPFSRRSVALLDVIAAQAAISLENARLHAELTSARDGVRAAEREIRLTVDTIPGLLWCARPDGSVEFLNRPWLDYAGLTMEQARDWGWAVALHPDDAQRVQAVWATILASGASGELEARLRRHDGVFRWFLFRAQAVRDEHGRVVRWYGTNTDIEDLKNAEAALRRSQENLNEAQRVSHTGSFTWNPATGDITWSPETYRIYEVDLATTPTLSIVTERTHPDDRPRTRAYLERAARNGIDWIDERRLTMPDGRIKTVRVIAHAVPGDDGAVTFAGAVKDVTVEKAEAERLQRALLEKEALLKEVHHRVKNNLQLISSLLSLAASRTANPEVVQLFTQSRNRVRSMALVHENLYRAGAFGEVAMAPHIENLCNDLARAHRWEDQPVRVTATSSDLELDLDRAVWCSLIISELVSNAFKHAFPDGREGNVLVDLSSGDGRRCVLCVRDDGIGLPPGQEAGGDGTLGLQLVHDLADQLHATVEVDRGAGTAFTFRFDGGRDRANGVA